MRYIEFSDKELQALANLLNSGVKFEGLPCVHNASILLKKIETAEEIKEAPKSVKEKQAQKP